MGFNAQIYRLRRLICTLGGIKTTNIIFIVYILCIIRLDFSVLVLCIAPTNFFLLI